MHFLLQDEGRSRHADALHIGERTGHLVSVLSISILWGAAHYALIRRSLNLSSF
jgi:hypothetical protein